MAFAAGAQNVGAPNEHIAWPVVWMVWVFTAHRQRTLFEAFDCVVFGLHPRCLGIAHHLQRIGLELRRRRQPTHALSADVVVNHAAAKRFFIRQGREHFFHTQFFVAPLIRVGVKETGGIHLPRWANPVQSKGQRSPAGLRSQLFLSHIVGPTATTLTDTAAHHQHIDHAAVVHIGVVPVVHCRANNDHRLAMGLVRVFGKLPRYGNQLLARGSSDPLLPCWGIGRVVIEVFGCQLTW